MYLNSNNISHSQFGNHSLNPTGGGMNSQMMMFTQLMTMMMNLMQMFMGGNNAMSCGCPGFGGEGFNSNDFSAQSPGAFLGMPSGGNYNSSSPFGQATSPFVGNGSPFGQSSAPVNQGTSPMPQVGTPQSAGNGYISPLDGDYRVSSGFGPRRAPTAGASTFHRGVDLAAPTGTPVRATRGGTVSISQHQTRNGRSTGYGNWIEIRHDDGTSSRYGHLNNRGVQVGQRVEAGQVIGTVGNTGTSTGAHLHFEIRNQQGQAVDPRQVMRV